MLYIYSYTTIIYIVRICKQTMDKFRIDVMSFPIHHIKASNLETVKFIIFITMFGSGMSCSNTSKFLRNSDIFQFHIILTFEQINSADSFVFSSSLKKILT